MKIISFALVQTFFRVCVMFLTVNSFIVISNKSLCPRSGLTVSLKILATLFSWVTWGQNTIQCWTMANRGTFVIIYPSLLHAQSKKWICGLSLMDVSGVSLGRRDSEWSLRAGMNIRGHFSWRRHQCCLSFLNLSPSPFLSNGLASEYCAKTGVKGWGRELLRRLSDGCMRGMRLPGAG